MSSAVKRKRSRSKLDEDDELASDIGHKPLSNAKRKRVNSTGPSPAVQGYFSSSKKKPVELLHVAKQGKENGSADEEEDELADEQTATPSKRKTKKDVFDVPSSPEEEKSVRRSGSARPKATSSVKKIYSTKGKGSTGKQRRSIILDEPAADIYDVPDIESSPERSKKSAASAETPKAVPLRSPDTPKPKPVRQRKSDILRQAKQLSNKATREKMVAEKESEVEVDNAAKTRSADSRRSKKADPLPELDAKSTSRSAVARRDLFNGIEHELELNSALTPSKGKRGRPRKSVAFESVEDVYLGFKDIPDSASAKKPSKKNTIQPSDIIQDSDGSSLAETAEEVSKEVPHEEQSSDADEDEGVACNICAETTTEEANPIMLCDKCENGAHMRCSGLKMVPKGSWLCSECALIPDDQSCGICKSPKQTSKNPIILCENCDNGIHLKCSGMISVPEEDWVCEDCSPEAKTVLPKSPGRKANTSSQLPDIENFETHLRCMQRVVLDKLTRQRRTKLIGHDDEMQKVFQVVEQTIVAGEGNSMLVIGARGCGKTTLVEQVISDLSSNHRENFHVVRLNGFIHTDDKLALREIWRQLGREMEVEDETTGMSNYADTLASLLALLSHPSEMSTSETDQTAKSVIFILDEFDLFTTHSRQTLLYNLFDIAQARKAPIVVLGLTTRVDVVETLEKRVKSRFSHRYVHLSLPRSLPAFWEICKEGLTAGIDELDTGDSSTSAKSRGKFMVNWQNMLEDLYTKDDKFKHQLQSHFYRSKSVPAFYTSCILPLASLGISKWPLVGGDFQEGQSLAPPDSKLQILQGLSGLELALLIAAARLDIIQDTDTCNFAMAYDEYSSLTSRHKIQTSSTGVAALGASTKVWGRDVALGAWERLADYDLLVPAGIGGGAARDFSAGGRMWKVDVGLEEITGSMDGLSTIMTKWCREI